MTLTSSTFLNSFTLLSLAFVGSSVTSCALEGADYEADSAEAADVATQQQPATVTVSRVWGRGAKIPVCWVNRGAEPPEREDWVRGAAAVWEEAGDVQFTGWGDCPDGPFDGISIQWGVGTWSALGTESKDLRPSMSLSGNFASVSIITGEPTERKDCNSDDPVWGPDGRQWPSARWRCLHATALHEFGHALGFGDEMYRSDMASPACDNPDRYSALEYETSDFDYVGGWNRSGVMVTNRCEPFFGKLSAEDIAGIQKYYGAPTNGFAWFHRGNAADLYGPTYEDRLEFFHWKLELPTNSTPYGGDFDGNGLHDILWHDKSDGAVVIWFSNAQTGADVHDLHTSLNTTDKLLVGDFDGDGDDDFFIYRPGSAAKELMFWSNGVGFNPDHGLTDYFTLDTSLNVNGTYTPLVGDFDGDKDDDIFWYRPGSGSDYVWWSLGNEEFSSQRTNVYGTYTPIVGNFDGDHGEDIFWWGEGSGADHIWWSNGTGWFSGTSTSKGGSGRFAVGDFDGTGTDDVLWNEYGDVDDVWLGETDRTFTHSVTAVVGNQTMIAGPFNLDDTDDIVFLADPTIVWQPPVRRLPSFSF